MPDPVLMGQAFAVAAAVAIVVALAFGRSSRPAVAAAGAVLAVAGATPAGLWVLGLLPHWPAQEALDRLLLILWPAAAATEIIVAWSPRAGRVARGAVAALAAPVLLHGSSYVTDLSGPGSREWPTGTAWAVYGTLAVVLLAAWAAMNRLAARTGGRAALWATAGVVLAAGLVTMLSGYATGGQLGVPLAAGLAGVALTSIAHNKRYAGAAAALGVGTVGLFGLLLVGRLFAGLTTLNAGLLFAAPLLGWLPEVFPARRGFRPVMRLALTAVPVVIAALLAYQQFVAGSAPPGSAGEGSLEDYMNFGK
jgi:hypothetical protein